MAQVLNPFAVRLNRGEGHSRYGEIQEVTGKPVYYNGYYSIWKRCPKCYDTCWKNIIITHTVGAPRELVDALVSGTAPTDKTSYYHYERMREAITDGLRYAKERDFEVNYI